MNARDAILARLDRALTQPEKLFRDLGADAVTEPAVPTAVTKARGGKTALAEQFGANLEAVLGSYEIVESAAHVAASLVRGIDQWKASQPHLENRPNTIDVLSWTPAEIPVPDLEPRLRASGISLLVPDDLHVDECRNDAAVCTVGLTGADAAFASTGTVALASGPGKSRAASLLPSLHLVIVPVSRIYPTFEAWLRALREEGRLPEFWIRARQIAFVTGPSKSADIELNLTLGVHGPGQIHAIVFDDER
jgi:L-lactate dehydrogenase complex protein LldG